MKATTETINAVRRLLEAGKPRVKREALLLLQDLKLTQADFTTTSQRALTTEDLELRAVLFAVQDM